MKIKFTLLGCGYSMGVPRIDGFFGNCDPREKKIIDQDVLLLFHLTKKLSYRHISRY